MTKGNETKTPKRDIKQETSSLQQFSHEQDFGTQVYESVMTQGESAPPTQGYDSTSMVELTVMKENVDLFFNPEQEISKDMIAFPNTIVEPQDLGSKNLKESINLLEQYYSSFSRSEKAINASITAHQVKLGKVLHIIKRKAKAEGREWKYVTKHFIPFINRRTRETYMQLAEIPMVEKYILFRKERILHIWQVIKDQSGEFDSDPIGRFLEKHGIDFETAIKEPLVEFKNMVDTAVVIEKASKKDLDLDRESVRGLIEMGFKFTNADFQQFKDSDDDPNVSLEKLLTNKGRRDTVPEKQEKKKTSFNRASTEMNQLVDQIIKEKNFENIDPEKITDLIKKLEDFKTKLIS